MAVDGWVITYDVASDRRRDRMATLLAGRGPRVLYSTFEFSGPRPAAYELFGRAAGLLDGGDRLLLFPTCRACHRRRLGAAIEQVSPTAWVVGG